MNKIKFFQFCRNARRALFVTLVSIFILTIKVRAFDYAESDLLVGFRQPMGNYEFVVNLGRATEFTGFARSNPGSSIAITNYPASMLSSAFSDLGNIQWSVFASVVTVGQVNPPYAAVWVSRPRASLNTQSEPWARRLAFSQSSMAGAVTSVGNGAKSAPGAANATAVIMDAGVSYGYAARVGPLGDFAGKWLGVVEGATPSDFVESKGLSRVDLYYAPPAPNSARPPSEYLGYFDFKWDGTMTFTAAGGAANPPPAVSAVAPTHGLPGETATLTGSNFSNGAKVFFGGVISSSVTINSATSITAVIPAHAPGLVEVIVTNADEQSATLPGAFTYDAPPPPQLSLFISGSLLQITTLGATNLTAIIYAADSIDAPPSGWTPIATNIVGADGLFTNSIPTSGIAGFVQVKIP